MGICDAGTIFHLWTHQDIIGHILGLGEGCRVFRQSLEFGWLLLPPFPLVSFRLGLTIALPQVGGYVNGIQRLAFDDIVSEHGFSFFC